MRQQQILGEYECLYAVYNNFPLESPFFLTQITLSLSMNSLSNPNLVRLAATLSPQERLWQEKIVEDELRKKYPNEPPERIINSRKQCVDVLSLFF